MLTAYTLTPAGPQETAIDIEAGIPADVQWLEVAGPAPAERLTAATFLQADLPTKEETEEIEFSSRFYNEDGCVFLTASVLTGVERKEPELVPFTFVIRGDSQLVTLRRHDLRAMQQFLLRANKTDVRSTNVPAVFLGLMEAIVDRAADVLETINKQIDLINGEIFAARNQKKGNHSLDERIGDIGVQGDLVAKLRESLASLERLMQYANLVLPGAFTKGISRNRSKSIARDIRSLEDHVDFLSNKINFLLDATLGLISVQQNEVIRVLTVAATIFFPPTLIGTIYGMNFVDMPELKWDLGYPVAIGLMIASAVLPYLYFKWRGWL